MRVVGGRLRGRAIAAPKSKTIRPTADRLRESLFNILTHVFDDPLTGARVLDLFAGTGALGIEALSRGAAFTLFVDDGAEARALLRENAATLGLGGIVADFSPRRDQTWRSSSGRPVFAGLSRSALWSRPCSRRTRVGTRRRVVDLRRACGR